MNNPCCKCPETIKKKCIDYGCEERVAYELDAIRKGYAVPFDEAVGYMHPYCGGVACSKCSEYPSNGGMCKDGSVWYDSILN